MTNAEKDLYIAIGKVLWEDWDPIGVNEFPEANDEYNGYIPSIFRLAVENADQQTIALKLNEFVQVNMGLFGDMVHCLEVADKIISVRDSYKN